MKTNRHPTHCTGGKRPRRIVVMELVIAILAAWTASAATLCVWQDSPNPATPHTDWTTAAHVIQDAVDAAADGDTVLVAGGVYSTGGRAVFGTMTNRVAIDKAITVESLMGPEVTLIEGAPSPGGGDGNDNGAIRCVYLGTNAVLSGFTLTNGYTRTSGDYSVEQSGGGAWCESSATLTNCLVMANTAECEGGGVYGGTLFNCTLTDNSAGLGGGASRGTLYNCALAGNSAYLGGGASGASGGTLYNCTVTGNSANWGGGLVGGTHYNCIVTGNSASWYGENYYGGIFYFSCTIPPPPGENNITADPLLATLTHLSTSSPCIGAGSRAYASGVDIDGEPWAAPPCIGADQLTSIQAAGPLTMSIKAEYTNVATGFTVRFLANNQGPILASVWDFDDGTVVTNQPIVSHAWSAPGSYGVKLKGYNGNFPAGVAATVQVEVMESVYYVNQANPTPAFPYTSWTTAATNIQQAIDAGTTIGRLVLVTNGVFASGSVEVEGTNRIALNHPVFVRSVNGPEVTVIEGTQGVRCAYVGANAILSGFTLTKGDAESGGGTWCDNSAILTNCVLTENSAKSYGGGSFFGALFNCTLFENSSDFTGGGAYGGRLYNCALTGNSAAHSGGGASGGALYNCTLIGNTSDPGDGGGTYNAELYNCALAANSAEAGGGSYNCSLHNCALIRNSARAHGGGYSDGYPLGDVYGLLKRLGRLDNCTLIGNSAGVSGGGTDSGALYNCIVYFNAAPLGANYSGQWVPYDLDLFWIEPQFYYTCITPLPTNGAGNLTNAPVFLNTNGWSDLHLRYGSPGIDAGTNLSDLITTDLNGNPRSLDGDGDGNAAFDMGAYEFDARSLIPPDWFTRHGLDPADPQVVSGNPDHDAFTTFQEWLADTDPTNAMSYFHIEAILKRSPVVVSFLSSLNRTYTLWRGSRLDPPDWSVVPGQQGISGTGSTLTLEDAADGPQKFYRVQVSLP